MTGFPPTAAGRQRVQITGNQYGQHQFLIDIRPGVSCYQGGWGSGKTWAAARKFCMIHEINRCPSLVTAPTMADIWRFCVPEIKAVAKEWRWQCEVYPSGHGDIKFAHMMLRGHLVYLISADDPKRFAGFEVGCIWGDEAARYKQDPENPLKDAPKQIMGRLRNKKAKILLCMWSTTPEGTETHIQQDFIDSPRKNYRIYYGSTTKNTAAPEQYKEMLLDMPAHLVQQYVDGIATNYTVGLAHPTFSEALHVSSDAVITRAPVHVGADFNVSPMCWVLFQDVGGKIRVFDEIVIEDFALVDDAMITLKDMNLHTDYGQQFIFHPDRSSKARSTTGESEFSNIVRLCENWGMSYGGNAHGANPPVTMRINNLSRLFRDGLGNSTITIHPRCEHLIENLKRTKRAKDGSYDPGKKGKWGHILDAFGYGVWDVRRPARHARFADHL